MTPVSKQASRRVPDSDVAVEIGANSIVNLSAQDDPGSPVAVMPAPEEWRAETSSGMNRRQHEGPAWQKGLVQGPFSRDAAIPRIANAARSEATRARVPRCLVVRVVIVPIGRVVAPLAPETGLGGYAIGRSRDLAFTDINDLAVGDSPRCVKPG